MLCRAGAVGAGHREEWVCYFLGTRVMKRICLGKEGNISPQGDIRRTKGAAIIKQEVNVTSRGNSGLNSRTIHTHTLR